MKVNQDDWQPEAWVYAVNNVVIPLIQADDQRYKNEQGPRSPSIRGESPSAVELALYEVTASMAPPTSLEGSGRVTDVLRGLIRERAETLEFQDAYRDPFERYSMAGSWICENFRKLIWWDCD
jgi:hypothetical protein